MDRYKLTRMAVLVIDENVIDFAEGTSVWTTGEIDPERDLFEVVPYPWSDLKFWMRSKDIERTPELG